MFGIYIHIPFCKQACHYCNYHFSTSLKHKERLLQAIGKELILRKDELKGEAKTIYFGGGTPSLLDEADLIYLFQIIFEHYTIAEAAEVTIETNPDDLSVEKLKVLANTPINRLSIGVQSFFEEDLTWMNRAHNAKEALESLHLAKEYFTNISIDLIYGIPQMDNTRWEQTLDIAFQLQIPHLSFYALTVEPNTALERFIEKKKSPPVVDDHAFAHYRILQRKAKEANYQNYEFSNFSQTGYYSQNNMAYWSGRPYLGIGPSAHGYNGDKRCWNIANNILYAKKIEEGELALECEELSLANKYNEYVMTRFRTLKGMSLSSLREQFGEELYNYALEQAKEHLEGKRLAISGDYMHVTELGRFQTDGMAGDLFFIER